MSPDKAEPRQGGPGPAQLPFVVSPLEAQYTRSSAVAILTLPLEVDTSSRSLSKGGTRGRLRCGFLLHGGEHPMTCVQANEAFADLSLGAEQSLFQLVARMTDELGAILLRLRQLLLGLRDSDKDLLAAFLDLGHRRARFPERHSGEPLFPFPLDPFFAVCSSRTRSDLMLLLTAICASH